MGYAEAQYTADEIINAMKTMGANESGVPPIKPFVTVIPAAQSVKVYWRVRNTDIEGQRICTVKGVMIRKKLGSPIKDLNDGELVGIYEDEEAWAHENNPLTISGLENGVWVWIGVWAFSDHNVYNLDMSNIYQVQPGVDVIYGFHQDFTDKNPLTSITYIGANAQFEPMYTRAKRNPTKKVPYNSSDVNNAPDYYSTPELRKSYTMGSWENWDWIKKIQTFLLDNGTEISGTKRRTFKKKNRLSDMNRHNDADTGELIIRSANNISDATVNLYTWIPRLYMKEVYSSDGNSRDVYFSETKYTSSTNGFMPVGFKNTIGEELKGFWLGYSFPGSTAVGSKPFHIITPFLDGNNRGLSLNTTLIAAYPVKVKEGLTNLSNLGMSAFGGSRMFFIRDVLYLLYRTTDIQEASGYGNGMNPSRYNYYYEYYEPNSKFNYLSGAARIFENIFWSGKPFYGEDGSYVSSYNGTTSGYKRSAFGAGLVLNNFALGSYLLTFFDPNIVLKDGNRFYISKNGRYGTNDYSQTNVYADTSAQYGGYPVKLKYLGDGMGSIPFLEASGNGSETTGLCDFMNMSADVTKDLEDYPPGSSDRYFCVWGANNQPVANAPTSPTGGRWGPCLMHKKQGIDPNTTNANYPNLWPDTLTNYSCTWLPVCFPPVNYTPYDDYEGGVPSQW